MLRGWRLILLMAALLLGAVEARADDNRPLTVSIEQDGRHSYRVSWKIPANFEAWQVPALSAGNACGTKGQQRNWSDQLGHWREEVWACSRGLAGRPVSITYPAANPNLASIVRYRSAPDAEPRTLLLQPQEASFIVEPQAKVQYSFRGFLVLGMEHIWIGIDHLLFVAGLIFIAGNLRRVLATVTGFTIAHSITLALAALDFVRLPISAIEGVIALSIVFLAVEIVKGPRDTLTWRQPVVVASAFGLLHGFGFAAVLAEVGLPKEGLVAALFAFNLGIEIGQIIFASVILLLLRWLAFAGQRTGIRKPLPRLAGYLVGSLASFWMFERMAG